jgi:hypothetical protein
MQVLCDDWIRLVDTSGVYSTWLVVVPFVVWFGLPGEQRKGVRPRSISPNLDANLKGSPACAPVLDQPARPPRDIRSDDEYDTIYIFSGS